MTTPEQLVQSIQDMPAMPNIIIKALNIAQNPTSSIRDLAQIIKYDQTLTAKVLTLVNSAYYGFPQQITSIDRALALLGMVKTKNIIVTVAMKPMLTKQEDKELWVHSIRTAVGCEHLADYLKIMDPDEAFVVGFLHDIGKIILGMADIKTCAKVIQMRETGADVIEVERLFFSTDHAQLGALLAKKWKLPILITNVIKYHHNPSGSSIPIACHLVHIVDKLVQNNYDTEEIKEEIANSLKMSVAQPEILRNNIMNKADILLRELSS